MTELWELSARDNTHHVKARQVFTHHQQGLPYPALRRAIDAMHRHLGEKMALQDIADAACMSRFHFARLFRRSTGYSPMKYLLHTRVEQAKTLLRQRTMAISDIAAEIGFADQSHLTRHFRRAVGMTPLQYARRCIDALSSEAKVIENRPRHGDMPARQLRSIPLASERGYL